MNDLLHGIAAVLVFFLASMVGLGRTGALAAGLLFALHPVQTEAVTSIVGRAEILAFTFAAGSLLLFLRNRSAFVVGAAFFLALLAKESAAFALPLFLWKRPETKRLVPLAGALAAYGALRITALGGLGFAGREIGFLDNPLAGASFVERLTAAPVLLLEYVRLVVWPRVLSADYSFDQIPLPFSASSASSIAEGRVLAGVAVVGLFAFVAYRGGRLGFAAFAFLVPLLGFLHVLFPLGTLLAERLLYLPMLGVALAFGLGIDALEKRSRPAGRAVAAFVLVAATARAVARNRDWRSNEALFRKTIETSPRSARSYFLLGAELMEKEEFPEAAVWFERGLAIYPTHFGARMSLGEAHLAAGDPTEAEEAFREALVLGPGSADARARAVEAALALGRERARAEDFSAARESFERAVALDEKNASAWNYLGLVSERQGRPEQARRQYERALAADPKYAPALVNLGSLLLNAGELTAAEEAFRRALPLAPRSYEAYNGLGIALARQGRRDEAAAAFERAIEIEPELEPARENLRALNETR